MKIVPGLATLLALLASVVLPAPANAAQTPTSTNADDHDPSPAVDYEMISAGAPDHPKVAAIEITPLGLLLGHYGGSLELVPVAHHGLVLSAYYASTSSADPQFLQLDPKNPVAVPVNDFKGVAAEVGYRYYVGRFGPHGLYVGPSLLLGSYRTDLHLTTFASTHVAFHDVGGAFDLGYQAIFGTFLIGASVGAQYVHASGSIPDQADVFADAIARSALRPRANLTFGLAF